MADEKKKLEPPQWLGKPIVDPEHVTDLETRAAINEFHSKMPRSQAESAAHDDYVKEQRERAAAHHLEGMKAAMATANHDDARKHWALYDLHLKALGKESVGSVPPEIEKRMNEDGRKPLYKFKAHKGDLYALHQPSEGVPEPMAKAEDLEKSEAGQCKWKLGERRCQRKVSGDYCHSHVDHWANKITQRETKAKELEKAYGLKKEELLTKPPVSEAQRRAMHAAASGDSTIGIPKSVGKEFADADKGGKLPAHKAELPPAGTGHLAAPALHSTVEGFTQAFAKLPKGSPQRSQLAMQHMNHAPLAQAFAASPHAASWSGIVKLGSQYANSTANAGPKGPMKLVVKSEESLGERFQTLFKAAKLVLTLKKGDVIKFPGNPAPAQDQGQAASVSRIPVRQPPKRAPARPAPAVDPGDYSHLIPAEHANKYRLRVVNQDPKSHTAQLLNAKGQVLGSVTGTPTGRKVASKPAGFPEPEVHFQDTLPQAHKHMLPWMQMAVHQHLGTLD